MRTYIRLVKKLMNKTLTVKQVAALLLVFIGILATVFVFSVSSSVQTVDGSVSKPRQAIIKSATYERPTDTTALGKLLAYVDSVSNAPELTGGTWAFYLCELDRDTPVCEVEPDLGLIPASVTKVVTTASALTLLGPDYRFNTSLQYDGEIIKEKKTLNGNLIIQGYGDPTLGAETFGSSPEKVMDDFIAAIVKMGIDTVNGSIIADAESWDRDPVPSSWAWEDMQNDYGIAPCGLNMRENAFDLLITPAGNKTLLKVHPEIPGLRLFNQVVVSGKISKPYAYVAGAPYQFNRVVIGEVAAAHQVKCAVPDPALFTAQLLKKHLEKNGVFVRDSAVTQRILRLNGNNSSDKKSRKVLLSLNSPRLKDIVHHTNQVSHNFYAEAILRAIAWKKTGFGNTNAGIAEIYKLWKSKGLDLRGMNLTDGSGVSRFNTITVRQLVNMLKNIAKDNTVFPHFYQSLPVAGESGTIRKLADGTAAEGNLHAKSGYMSRVRAYAGYVDSKSGKRMAFAMIGNNTLWDAVSMRDKFERLFVLMAELP
ncbi:MAG: D-alanyl-D-alanine carboxypeptidase/D-alanyl-D-alanine-endopeptidase [Bacteroidia bacterium]